MDAETLNDLPSLVLDKLVEFLDFESRKRCRLVSQTLKRHVDFIGLSVRIDTLEPGILEFLQDVNVAEGQIYYLGSNLNPEPELESMNTAIFSGSLGPSWMSRGLSLNCPNLSVLILNGTALIGQDFGEPPDPDSAFPAFRHLRELHITLDGKTVFQGTRNLERSELVRLIQIDPVPDQLHQQNPSYYSMKMDQKIQKNMTYLMSTVRSGDLRVFHAFVFARRKDEKRELRWEHDPLFQFIQSHAHSLQRLALPCLFSGNLNLEPKVYQIPTRLKTFHWTPTTRYPFPIYWKDLLLAQVSLEQLALKSLQIPVQELMSLFASLSSNNYRTLTYVQLQFFQKTIHIPSFDLAIFSSFKVLKTLVIHGGVGRGLDMPYTRLHNLNSLPRSLTSLKCAGTEIGEDFDGVKFMEDFRPAYLALTNVSSRGPFQDPKVLLQFIKILLRNRVLDVVSLSIDFNDYVPSEWSLGSTVVQLETDGLELWMRNLARLQDHLEANHRLLSLKVTYISPWTNLSSAGGGDSCHYYKEETECLSYMDLICKTEYYDLREQPYVLPLNAESYTIWRNQTTAAFKVIPNTQSYSRRFKDISSYRFKLNFVLEGTETRDFKPVGWADLGRTTGEYECMVKGMYSIAFEPDTPATPLHPSPNLMIPTN